MKTPGVTPTAKEEGNFPGKGIRKGYDLSNPGRIPGKGKAQRRL
jgi:hypothetical protein